MSYSAVKVCPWGKKCIPVRPRPVIPPHMIHFEPFLTRYAGGTWFSWGPQAISFFGLGSWNKSWNKITPFFRSEVFVLRSKFQSRCTLLGREQKFPLPSQRSPTFAFHKPPDGVFPPTWPLLANCCESCLVEFPLLALFRIPPNVQTFSAFWKFL